MSPPPRRLLRRVLLWGAAALGGTAAALAGFVFWQVRAFDRSVARVYDVPLPAIQRSTDPAVIERGAYLGRSLGECIVCHGEDMAGGREEPLGPLGKIVVPNVTGGGRSGAYSDAELARLIKHGLKRDGTTVMMMPSQNMAWWSDEDVTAVVSWLRTVPAAQGNQGVVELAFMAKILDRFDSIPLDVARRIEHDKRAQAPEPAPTAAYGAYVATSCRGCHGPTLAGGPIPGAPPGLAVPANLTLHDTGLRGYTYDTFASALRDGRRKDGQPLDAFMPVAAVNNLSDLDKRALWAYIESMPALPLGAR